MYAVFIFQYLNVFYTIVFQKIKDSEGGSSYMRVNVEVCECV